MRLWHMMHRPNSSILLVALATPLACLGEPLD